MSCRFWTVLALALLAAPAAAADVPAGVIAAINDARAHPQAYAAGLRAYRGYYHGRQVDAPDEAGTHLTREGVAAVDDAIAFLERQPPLPPLTASTLLAGAAADHAAAQGRSGDTGHVSADGATPGQRVQRRGGGIYVSETIAYGFSAPVAVVRQLIVDDGVADRGHRRVIFDPRLAFAGAGCGPHPVYSAMCVVDFAATLDGRPAVR